MLAEQLHTKETCPILMLKPHNHLRKIQCSRSTNSNTPFSLQSHNLPQTFRRNHPLKHNDANNLGIRCLANRRQSACMNCAHIAILTRDHTFNTCRVSIRKERAHGVVVSHPLRMRKALGSNPSGSIIDAALPPTIAIHAHEHTMYPPDRNTNYPTCKHKIDENGVQSNCRSIAAQN